MVDPETPSHPTSKTKRNIIIAGVGVLIPLVAVLANATGLVVNWRTLTADSPPAGTSATSGPPSAAVVAPQTSTMLPTDEAGPVPSSPPRSRSVALTLEDADVVESCAHPGNSGYSWATSSPTIAGTPYVNGFQCLISHNPTTGSVDFLVPSGFTHFTAVAGQPDDTANTTAIIRFQLVDAVSGTILEEHDTHFGVAASFDADIGGILRIKLVTSYVSSTQPVNSFDTSAAQADTAWADAEIN